MYTEGNIEPTRTVNTVLTYKCLDENFYEGEGKERDDRTQKGTLTCAVNQSTNKLEWVGVQEPILPCTRTEF